MSTWFRFESTTPDHPKVAKLARKLGVSRVQALGHLTCLWARVSAAAPDGDLTSYDADDIAVFASWEGDEQVLVEALEAARLVDVVLDDEQQPIGFELHDWMERAEGHRRAKAARDRREAERQARAAEAKATREARAHDASSPRSARDHATGQDRQDRQDRTPQEPPEGAGLLALTVAPPKRSPRPKGSPPRSKGPRALWWLTMARARGALDDVEAVVEAYRRHHPRAKPGDLERGMIAERLLGDDPPFTAAELVEAIDGCHASDFHVEGGHTGLELIMRDRGKVESFRLKGEAKAAGGGRTKTNDAASKAWAEVVAAVPHWRRREPFEVSDTARRGLKASGGASRLMACDERGLAKMRGEFMAALGGRAA